MFSISTYEALGIGAAVVLGWKMIQHMRAAGKEVVNPGKKPLQSRPAPQGHKRASDTPDLTTTMVAGSVFGEGDTSTTDSQLEPSHPAENSSCVGENADCCDFG
jgi:hypothetical protein